MKGGSVDSIGSLIAGRYRVLALLGRGGMASVYKATDERTGKQLAIKRSSARDPSKLQRLGVLLEREYHTLAQLAHPCIIEVYDYGVDARGPYYTMELLQGRGLEGVERLPWREVCAVLRDVGSSLAILHSRGLVHRDVTLRNVHYAADGHVKLLDFGAMMSMGVAKDTVGTPPFMAPEVLQLQALDARVDLFSLGALGYRLLTGRHAYPARRFSELRDVWRSKPQPPAANVPDVPAELSTLILRLLTLDRGGRPQSAPELIARLSNIADLPHEDPAKISRAYLTTPTLVGREPALLDVRRRMLSLVRGDGGVLLVRGEAGSGRSRLLDACALEGKLLGAAVVRADARDASSGDWGVARALGQQLFEQFPEQAQDAARLSRNVLGQLFESLRSDDMHTATGYAYERSVLTRELRDWVLTLSKQQRLLMIVDDLDRCDDASVAFVSALAHRADRHPLLLTASVERKRMQAPPASLRLMQEVGQVVELDDLSAADSEALMRSVFGDVPNLPLCAARIFQIAHGSPRATMELAQHLVDRNSARYERGSWILPGELNERDLPRTLTASLGERLAELSPDARELAEVLALANDDALQLGVYPALTSHGDAKRVFRALDELVASRILVADADRLAFAQRGFLTVLADGLATDTRVEMHTRIARVLATRGGDLLRRAHHLLAAQLEDDAINLLCRVDLTAENPPLPLLRDAIAAAERMELPASTLHRLRMALLVNAPLAMAFDDFRAVVPVVLKQLEQDSGLGLFRELAHLPEGERLAQALTQAQAAYSATPERERVYTVLEAIRELARLFGTISAMAVPTFDLDLLESLPSLEPLFSLSPALRVVTDLLEGSKEWVRGRPQQSRAIYERVLARVSEPDHAGLDDAQYERIRLGLDYTTGLLLATLGIPSAEQYAKELEKHQHLRVNAWRIRAFYQLAIGDVTDARKCQRRAELLQAQDGLKERFAGSSVGMELVLYARMGDLLGVRNATESAAVMAAQHRGWRPVELLGRSRCAELQGDLENALKFALEGLDSLPPLRHPFYTSLASAHVRVLLALGREHEAAEQVKKYRAFCGENGMITPEMDLLAAQAFGKVGEFQPAVQLSEALIRQAETYARSGLIMAVCYEVRARIAIWMRDSTTFEQMAQRAAAEYEVAKNPSLTSRLTRLLDEAREHGVAFKPVERFDTQATPPDEGEFETIHSRIAECIDAADRARCALTLLLQSTLSTTGYLYGLNTDQSISLLAALPDPPSDGGILSWVDAYAREWLTGVETSEATTVVSASSSTGDTQEADEPRRSQQRYSDHDGRNLEAALLFDDASDGRRLVAVFVQQVAPREHITPPRQLCLHVARELVSYGDASGWR